MALRLANRCLRHLGFGCLAAVSASSFSFVSLLKHFIPIIKPGGATISLRYIASEKVITGYGGGMSSAKAALESDTRVPAFEVGRRYKIRVKTISARPLRSRTVKAIGFIDTMIRVFNGQCTTSNRVLGRFKLEMLLHVSLASAITGNVRYVDNGLHAMGVGVDNPAFVELSIPKSEH